MLPFAIAAIYYLAIAANQYVAEFRMSLRRVDAPQIEPALFLGGDLMHGAAAAESQIVAQYIASRAIVDELDPALDLRTLFSPQAADWVGAPAVAGIDRGSWCATGTGRSTRSMTHRPAPSSSGCARLRRPTPSGWRRRSSPRRKSWLTICRLGRGATRSATPRQEIASAEQRLTVALEKIREFRDKSGLIDPGKAADATAQLATKLRDDLLKANSQLATLKTYMHDDAPPVRVLKARIHALETQERGLAHEMTATTQPATPPLSQTLGSYDTLEAERKFAEAAYQHALEALDHARDNADRQQIYIASFVPPSLPEQALYPHRWRSLGIVGLIAFAVWAIGSLAVQSVRDHL